MRFDCACPLRSTTHSVHLTSVRPPAARNDYYGKPLLRDQEFLPWELLEEFRKDTEWQMHRIEVRSVPVEMNHRFQAVPADLCYTFGCRSWCPTTRCSFTTTRPSRC